MKQVLKQVRTKGKVVSETQVNVYENLDELIASEKPEQIVADFNHGSCVRIMGNERAKFAGTKTGKKLRMKLAFNMLTVDELMSVVQDSAALEALCESDKIQARIDKYLEESGATTESPEAEADDIDGQE